MKLNLKVNSTPQEGVLQNTYQALENLKIEGGISEFDTDRLNWGLDTSLEIECQPSYDGSVNIITNDGKNTPKMINSRLAYVGKNKYYIPERNQSVPTNIYTEDNLPQEANLIKAHITSPKISLSNVIAGGELKGGNYVFYLQLTDEDYNTSDICAESGPIPVFHGSSISIDTVSGTLENEQTDKTIILNISDLDLSYPQFILTYTRYYSDLNGILKKETKRISKPYDIKIDEGIHRVTVNGLEECIDLNDDELDIVYHNYTSVQTHAQVQNMLFFGNVTEDVPDNVTLQKLSYYIQAECVQENDIGLLDTEYYNDDSSHFKEYYNPIAVNKRVGYFPGEYYRFGVVYIMSNGSLSPVYNLKGCTDWNGLNISDDEIKSSLDSNKLPFISSKDIFFENSSYNTKGVFKIPELKLHNIEDETTKPIHIKFTIHPSLQSVLEDNGVKGFFIVRQNRIPIFLAQGFCIGVEDNTHIPVLYDTDEGFFTQTFIDYNKSWRLNPSKRNLPDAQVSGRALVCVDSDINMQLRSCFSDEVFVSPYAKCALYYDNNAASQKVVYTDVSVNGSPQRVHLTYIDSDVSSRSLEGSVFSTRVGDASTINNIRSVDWSSNDSERLIINNKKCGLVRGIYTSYLGATGDSAADLHQNYIYNIYSGEYDRNWKNIVEVRALDKSPFRAVSDRVLFTTEKQPLTLDVYRGDCFTNTSSVKFHRNFINPESPTNDLIVDTNPFHGVKVDISGKIEGENDKYLTFDSLNPKDATTDMRSFKVQLGDWNAVKLGYYLTYKSLSNYNLNYRSEDRRNTQEMSVMGNARSFYPLVGKSKDSAVMKLPESYVANQGYSIATPGKKYFEWSDVPFQKKHFQNRIAFSKVSTSNSFQNGYRVFQSMAYKDIETKYGAIIKLISYGTNLFCVFEHGCAIIPVNEKALQATTTGQSIHIYGAGVLHEQVSPISEDYGSIWKDSVIITPNAIYGVDTFAKKIWAYDTDGFKIISDMSIQRFLNENIDLNESQMSPVIGSVNVKTHYNNYKGDVMFTFYNGNRVWNICYNERLGKWTTRYSWTPIVSENIDNRFISMDLNSAKWMYSMDKYNRNVPSPYLMLDDSDASKGPRYTLQDVTGHNESTLLTLKYLYGVNNETIDDIVIYGVHLRYIQDNEVRSIYVPFNCLEKHSIEGDGVYYTISDSVIKYQGFKIDDDAYIEVPTVSDIIPLNIALDIEYKIQGVKMTDTVCASLYFTDDDIKNLKHELSSTVPAEKSQLLQVYELHQTLGAKIYVHGMSGIYDELDYGGLNSDNHIKPTFWYDNQEPFEFEFAVNQPAGLHKIFDNLVILSNNVEPNSIEFEIIGDAYNFKELVEQENYYTTVDSTTNQTHLHIIQKIKNIENKQYGRLKGNIGYIEDKWNLVIEPIKYNGKSARIRDKWMKVRIKYSGEKLAVIHFIQTLMRVSYV